MDINQPYHHNHRAPAKWLKLSKCGLGSYLDGRSLGKTELLLEEVLVGQ